MWWGWVGSLPPTASVTRCRLSFPRMISRWKSKNHTLQIKLLIGHLLTCVLGWENYLTSGSLPVFSSVVWRLVMVPPLGVAVRIIKYDNPGKHLTQSQAQNVHCRPQATSFISQYMWPLTFEPLCVEVALNCEIFRLLPKKTWQKTCSLSCWIGCQKMWMRATTGFFLFKISMPLLQCEL